MTDLRSFLQRLVSLLGEADVDYMLTGSMASTLYGRPRSTQDLDLVVQLTSSHLGALLPGFDPDTYYVDESAAREAIRQRSQFNVIDLASGWKADLIVRKDRPFSHTEFGRRRRAVVLGTELWVATAEDVVVSKLEWAKRSGGSERQMGDVEGILAQQGDSLDRDYIKRWCDTLGLLDLWDHLADEP